MSSCSSFCISAMCRCSLHNQSASSADETQYSPGFRNYPVPQQTPKEGAWAVPGSGGYTSSTAVTGNEVGAGGGELPVRMRMGLRSC